MALRIIMSKAEGIPGLISVGSGGISCMCFRATETDDSPSKGSLPVTISKNVTPME